MVLKNLDLLLGRINPSIDVISRKTLSKMMEDYAQFKDFSQSQEKQMISVIAYMEDRVDLEQHYIKELCKLQSKYQLVFPSNLG
jgi:hypothetical protein